MTFSKELKLSIIVISYNTRVMTLECIRSVFNQTRKVNFELIVLDNASIDGSVEAINAEFGRNIRVVESKDNLGFASGNNYAAKLSTGDYLLLLNPDTIVKNRAIDNLVEYATKKPNDGIWGGKTIFKNGDINPASCWSKQTIWSLFCQAVGLTSVFRKSSVLNPEGIGGWDRSGSRQVDIVSGCFLLIKRSLWNQLGGFRKSFFMYGEEADLCLRATEFGVSPSVTDKATIVHYGGASETVRADKLVRLIHAKHLLIEYHFSPKTRRLGHTLLSLWPRSRYFAHKMLALFGCVSSKNNRDVWREVSLRQSEWLCLLEDNPSSTKANLE